MASKLSFHQIFVLGTAAMAVAFFAGMVIYESRERPVLTATPITHPMIGKAEAKVEVVVFEDFRCGGCRKFHENVFPEIRSRYIESGLVRCRFVPLGFLEGSKPLANAALAVYKLSPNRFAEYTSALFHRFESEPVENGVGAVLMSLAIQIGGIDLKGLKTAIEEKLYYPEVDQNLDWAKRIMGKKFRLPAVYVNGIAGATADLHALEKLIEALR